MEVSLEACDRLLAAQATSGHDARGRSPSTASTPPPSWSGPRWTTATSAASCSSRPGCRGTGRRSTTTPATGAAPGRATAAAPSSTRACTRSTCCAGSAGRSAACTPWRAPPRTSASRSRTSSAPPSSSPAAPIGTVHGVDRRLPRLPGPARGARHARRRRHRGRPPRDLRDRGRRPHVGETAHAHAVQVATGGTRAATAAVDEAEEPADDAWGQAHRAQLLDFVEAAERAAGPWSTASRAATPSSSSARSTTPRAPAVPVTL